MKPGENSQVVPIRSHWDHGFAHDCKAGEPDAWKPLTTPAEAGP